MVHTGEERFDNPIEAVFTDVSPFDAVSVHVSSLLPLLTSSTDPGRDTNPREHLVLPAPSYDSHRTRRNGDIVLNALHKGRLDCRSFAYVPNSGLASEIETYRLGIQANDIDLLVVSHAHLDHMSGLPQLFGPEITRPRTRDGSTQKTAGQ
ncbi:MBL fold metallo-hydrolase [Arthrobacter sp. NPDC093128]|uniref:MBL fold metallo-hydrolase n=1 Tax=Arthrobacter sp. NPDC093128 TaxID=3154979 RepID=UPI0034472A8D